MSNHQLSQRQIPTREMVEANLKAERAAWKKRADSLERENVILREWLDDHGFDVERILREHRLESLAARSLDDDGLDWEELR